MRVSVGQTLIFEALAEKITPGGGGGVVHNNEGRPAFSPSILY